MASIERTAYPCFGKRMSAEELRARYELVGAEQDFVGANANGDRQRLTLAALLKIRQQLGYFPDLKEVPGQIVQYLTSQLGFADQTQLLRETNLRTTLHRYRTAVREFLGSKAYGHEARQALEQVIRKAAETMSDPADLINVAVAELSKAGVDLPAFSTLDRLAGNLRQQVHAELYARMTGGLTADQKIKLDDLLTVPPGGQVSGFALLKKTPGPPELKYIREWAARLEQLDGILDPKPFLAGIPHTKARQFAAEATALETAKTKRLSRQRQPPPTTSTTTNKEPIDRRHHRSQQPPHRPTWLSLPDKMVDALQPCGRPSLALDRWADILCVMLAKPWGGFHFLAPYPPLGGSYRPRVESRWGRSRGRGLMR